MEKRFVIGFILPSIGIFFSALSMGLAFASVESVFQIDIKDADSNKDYSVCMVSDGYEAVEGDCLRFKGSDFDNYFAEFVFDNLLIGDPFYVSIEDIETNEFVYEDVQNTEQNPQTIEMSVDEENMGPKQPQAREFDKEG
jgi:hypothetical protein